MFKSDPRMLSGFFAVCLAVRLFAAGPVYTDPSKADPDFAIQGEYAGTVNFDGEIRQAANQVIALGEGRFQAVAFWGGLPGAGWNGKGPYRADGKRTEEGVLIEGEGASALIRDGQMEVRDASGNPVGTWQRVERKSPTLEMTPPPEAVVLFDGSNVDSWDNGRRTEEGLLEQGTTSKLKLQSHKLHIEFRLPYQPLDRGQARGNSGVYLQGRYEVQMLDSFGLDGQDNECGGIYSIRAPSINMCLPPLSWQTYDIDFVAAKYDEQGQLLQNPRMTVRHNGILIHENVELPKSTTAAPLGPGPEPGPVYLQDHGCPVRYRNIWVVPVSES